MVTGLSRFLVPYLKKRNGLSEIAKHGRRDSVSLSCIAVVIGGFAPKALVDVAKAFGAENGLFHLSLFHQFQFGQEPVYNVPRMAVGSSVVG